MTHEEARVLFETRLHEERLLSPDCPFGCERPWFCKYCRNRGNDLRKLAEAKRATANALEILASFAIEGDS